MKPALLLALTLGSVAAAATRVGSFPAEIRHTYHAANSALPSNDVRCVAVAAKQVFAGTAKGLAAREGSAWKAIDNRPVSACAVGAANSLVAVTDSGEVLRVSSSGAPAVIARLHGDAAAPIHAIAEAPRSGVYIATDRGLFDTRGKRHLSGPVYAVAVSPTGEVAAGAAAGLFIAARAEYPRDGTRSWAPTDVKGVTFDASGRLAFSSPQGFGIRQSNGAWTLYTGAEGLPFDEATTLAAGEAATVFWLGTTRGAIRYDGRQWAYRQGLRWLPDDNVRAIAVAFDGTAWFATAKGVGRIERRPMQLSEKARLYEDAIDARHRRTPFEYVHSVELAAPGDLSQFRQTDSDNDGLWTSMYGAGECYAYAATKDPLARRRAVKAFEALRFLSQVTQSGEHPAPPGFPARAILPTSGPDPNVRDSRDRDVRVRAQRDHLWKVLAPRWPKSADGKWYWKTDTSSDELDGHYYFYALYYDLVAAGEKEKEDLRTLVRAITDHILEHDWSLVDWDGTRTRWAVFHPATLNGDRMWWAGRGLNSLSILSYLKVTHHITGDAKYESAYRGLIRDHHYDTNLMVPKIQAGPGSGNQSDDEMAFMGFYTLLKYETDPELRQKYALALADYWAIERLERNPFFNFAAVASLTGATFDNAYGKLDLTPKGDWLAESIDMLQRLPLDRVDWAHRNSHRKDIVPVRLHISEDEGRPKSGHLRNGSVLPVDERYFGYWNHNPYQLDSGGAGRSEGDGAVFLLPYYMGLYHGYFEN
ncbi:MAG: hypothetical protein U0Q16_25225 [Bryobacteraceae bacterium]